MDLTYLAVSLGEAVKVTHKVMTLASSNMFMLTKMNQVATFILPVTSLNTVNAKEVLLSAAATIRMDTVVFIKNAREVVFWIGTLYTCFPRPSLTANVDVMAGTSTANLRYFVSI